jgi:catechol 2,3-dioxygenase-like lactoylglutathione lyase family enzyme
MTITGLNHLTLAVSELERSVKFYSELLGFVVRWHGPSSAYLEAGTLWLALVEDKNGQAKPSHGYSHAAFSVEPSALPEWGHRLIQAGVVRWQESTRDNSFYFLDPDGHKLELHAGNLESRLSARAPDL